MTEQPPPIQYVTTVEIEVVTNHRPTEAELTELAEAVDYGAEHLSDGTHDLSWAYSIECGKPLISGHRWTRFVTVPTPHKAEDHG